MKRNVLFLLYSILMICSGYAFVSGILSLNPDLIDGMIKEHMSRALYPAGIDIEAVVRKMQFTLQLAGVALTLIGLTGLVISILGLYGLIKNRNPLAALSTPGSIIGICLFLASLASYWYIFRDLRPSKFRLNLYNLLPVNYSDMHPWPFVVAAAAGFLLLAGSTVIFYRKSVKSLFSQR